MGPAPGRPFHSLKITAEVGRGAAAFRAAGDAILSLDMQRGAGLGMRADHEPVQVGDVVRIRMGLRPFAVSGSCDVTEVFSEDRRTGFTYRTRPDHPEDGTETFQVHWLTDDRVLVTIDAKSRPNSWLTRLGGPIARLAQRVISQRYLASARRIVARSA
jgi:uncharacterized protein (UPF0548 family)